MLNGCIEFAVAALALIVAASFSAQDQPALAQPSEASCAASKWSCITSGEAYRTGNTTPELIDYAAGGSAKYRTQTLDGAPGLDVDTGVQRKPARLCGTAMVTLLLGFRHSAGYI